MFCFYETIYMFTQKSWCCQLYRCYHNSHISCLTVSIRRIWQRLERTNSFISEPLSISRILLPCFILNEISAVSVFVQKWSQRCCKSLKLPGFADRCSLKWRKTDTAVKKDNDIPVLCNKVCTAPL